MLKTKSPVAHIRRAKIPQVEHKQKAARVRRRQRPPDCRHPNPDCPEFSLLFMVRARRHAGRKARQTQKHLIYTPNRPCPAQRLENQNSARYRGITCWANHRGFSRVCLSLGAPVPSPACHAPPFVVEALPTTVRAHGDTIHSLAVGALFRAGNDPSPKRKRGVLQVPR